MGVSGFILTKWGGGDTQTLLDGFKHWILYTHGQWGCRKTLWFSLALVSAPYEPPGETFTT